MKGKFIYSVIIPHYHIPDLLIRCLKSVPVRSDTEILVVDDFSPDFEKTKTQIEVEFKGRELKFFSTGKRSGPGIARNIGIENATGKWLVFVDADDFFSDSTDDIFNEYADAEADIVFCHMKAVKSEDITVKADDYVYEDCFIRYNKNKDEKYLRYFIYSVCGKLIRREFVRSGRIRFDERYYGEDLLFAVRLGYYANRISVCDKVLNVITARNGSLSRSWKDWPEWFSRFYPAHIAAMRFLNSHNVHALDGAVPARLLPLLRIDKKAFFNLYKMFTVKERFRFYICILKRGIRKLMKWNNRK